MKIEPNPVRGMRDILPREMNIRDHSLAVILDTYKKWGFSHIETPALENIETLASSKGGENEKLIYKILKRGEKLDLSKEKIKEEDLVDMGLRFDLTVPLARYYAANQASLPKPFKAIQIGPVWRAERPQKGRFRQFTQCDIDIIGEPSLNAEMELILATSEALLSLGFSDFAVHLSDRKLLNEYLSHLGVDEKEIGSVYIIADKYGKIGKEGVEKELQAIGFNPDKIQKIFSFLESSGKNSSIDTVIRAVKNHSQGHYKIVFDPSLIRGIGYYTGLIFEIRDKSNAAGYSIAGGGRYDKMIGQFLGQEVPACGFSIGFERIISILMEKNTIQGDSIKKIALLYEDGADFEAVLDTAKQLREKGQAVSMLPKRKNMHQQLDELVNQGCEGFAVFQPGKPPEVKELEKPS